MKVFVERQTPSFFISGIGSELGTSGGG